MADPASEEKQQQSNVGQIRQTSSSDRETTNGSDEKHDGASDAKPTSTHRNLYFRHISEKTTALPPWLNHFNRKDMKMLFKCCLAVWVYELLIFINPTLRAIGQATFFGAIVLFINPPSGVFLVTFLASTTAILGICLAWAWGVITMKAAYASRPAAELQQKYIELQRLASPNTTNSNQASGQSRFTQIAVYNGFFLNDRVTIIFVCMICLYIYVVARVRSRAPKLTLVFVFGVIISDVQLTIAPLLPTFNGTIAKVLVVPAAIATGIGLVSNLLVFPRSSSHIVVDCMQDFFRGMNEFLDACCIKVRRPSEHMDLGRLQKYHAQIIGLYKTIQPPLAFLSMDLSYGKLSAQDIISLQQPLRQVFVTFNVLLLMQTDRELNVQKDKKLQELINALESSDQEAPRAGQHHVSAMFNFRQQYRHWDSHIPSEESAPLLCQTYVRMLKTCQDAVSMVMRCLNECNSVSFSRKGSTEDAQQNRNAEVKVLEALREQIDHLAERAAAELWAHFSPLIDVDRTAGFTTTTDNGGLRPLHGLVLSMIFEENLLNYAQALEALLIKSLDLKQQRPKSRLWLPAKLRDLFSWAFSDDEPASGAMQQPNIQENRRPELVPKVGESSGNKKDDDAKTSKTQSAAMQLARMRRTGGRRRSGGGAVLLGIVHWFGGNEGIFALRVVACTIVLAAIALNRTTAGFFYRERGLWALIMAQTGLAPYMADFVLSLLSRITGTLVGAIFGLVAWYIGAGSGPGNPYGMAAITVPFIIIFMWCRLFLPPAITPGLVMGGATFYLVVGYSWNDTHVPSYGAPGVGYEVFWRRLLLVLVGFAVSSIITILPRPPSANAHQRQVLADAISAAKNQFALLVANCMDPHDDLDATAEKTGIQISEVLLATQPQIKFSKLEFSTSAINADALGIVCYLCLSLNRSLTRLLLTAPKMPDTLKGRFIRVTGCMDERLVADVMTVLTLVEQAIRLDQPLPMVMPVLLSTSSRIYAERSNRAPNEHLDQAMLAEAGSRKYCASMSAMNQFLTSVDELVIVVKRAVGETASIDVELQ